MAVQLWMRDDIYNVLMGLELTSAQQAAIATDAMTQAYRAGFRAALLAVGASFGIAPRAFGPETRPVITIEQH